jgi:hypothetical protein
MFSYHVQRLISRIHTDHLAFLDLPLGQRMASYHTSLSTTSSFLDVSKRHRVRNPKSSVLLFSAGRSISDLSEEWSEFGTDHLLRARGSLASGLGDISLLRECIPVIDSMLSFTAVSLQDLTYYPRNQLIEVQFCQVRFNSNVRCYETALNTKPTICS